MTERVQRKVDAVTDDDWEGWHVKDMPWVRKDPPNGQERSIDQMLKVLDRRVEKNGRLKEYEENQYFTKPSEKRRQREEEREYMLDKKLDRE